MKNLTSLLILSLWLIGWSAPLLSSPCSMKGGECCQTEQIQKSVSITSECRAHCGEDDCCRWKESEASDSPIQPALRSFKYEDQKSPLVKREPLLLSNKDVSKDQGIHPSRAPTILSKSKIPSYLKYQQFLI
mgnify:CR=1 FL=1